MDWDSQSSKDYTRVSEELKIIGQAKFINGVLTGNHIYHFNQGPETSVLFRTRSSLGPVAVHEFISDKKNGGRSMYTAQLRLSAH